RLKPFTKRHRRRSIRSAPRVQAKSAPFRPQPRPRAQQASKLETRALFAGSQGGTVARAGGNTCGPLSARLDLKAPAVRYGPHRTIYLTGIDANGKVARASARRRFRVLS